MSHTDSMGAAHAADDSPLAIVTGAQQGLGLALSRRLLELGWMVFAGVLEKTDGIGQLTGTFGDRIVPLQLDVTSRESIRSAASAVAERGRAVDLIINNAGIHPDSRTASIDEVDLFDGHLEAEMQVNAFGIVRVVQTFLPLLREEGWRRIINITSEAGSIGDCWRDREFGYSMSKSAANMATALLHNALSKRGIVVRAMHPGWVRTPMAGPNAELSAEEAARAVCEVALQSDLDRKPLYLDNRGAQLSW